MHQARLKDAYDRKGPAGPSVVDVGWLQSGCKIEHVLTQVRDRQHSTW